MGFTQILMEPELIQDTKKIDCITDDLNKFRGLERNCYRPRLKCELIAKVCQADCKVISVHFYGLGHLS